MLNNFIERFVWCYSVMNKMPFQIENIARNDPLLKIWFWNDLVENVVWNGPAGT